MNTAKELKIESQQSSGLDQIVSDILYFSGVHPIKETLFTSLLSLLENNELEKKERSEIAFHYSLVWKLL